MSVKELRPHWHRLDSTLHAVDLWITEILVAKKNTNRFFGDLYKSGWCFFSPTPPEKYACAHMSKWKSSPNRHLKHTVWNHHPASVLHCKSPLFLLCPEVDSCPWVVFYLKLPNFDGWFWCTPLAAKNQTQVEKTSPSSWHHRPQS